MAFFRLLVAGHGSWRFLRCWFSLFPIDLSDTNFVFSAVSTSAAVLRTAFFVTLVLDEVAELEFSKFLSFPT